MCNVVGLLQKVLLAVLTLPIRIGLVACQLCIHQAVALCYGREFPSTSLAIDAVQWPLSIGVVLTRMNAIANRAKHSGFSQPGFRVLCRRRSQRRRKSLKWEHTAHQLKAEEDASATAGALAASDNTTIAVETQLAEVEEQHASLMSLHSAHRSKAEVDASAAAEALAASNNATVDVQAKLGALEVQRVSLKSGHTTHRSKAEEDASATAGAFAASNNATTDIEDKLTEVEEQHASVTSLHSAHRSKAEEAASAAAEALCMQEENASAAAEALAASKNATTAVDAKNSLKSEYTAHRSTAEEDTSAAAGALAASLAALEEQHASLQSEYIAHRSKAEKHASAAAGALAASNAIIVVEAKLAELEKQHTSLQSSPSAHRSKAEEDASATAGALTASNNASNYVEAKLAEVEEQHASLKSLHSAHRYKAEGDASATSEALAASNNPTADVKAKIAAFEEQHASLKLEHMAHRSKAEEYASATAEAHAASSNPTAKLTDFEEQRASMKATEDAVAAGVLAASNYPTTVDEAKLAEMEEQHSARRSLHSAHCSGAEEDASAADEALAASNNTTLACEAKLTDDVNSNSYENIFKFENNLKNSCNAIFPSSSKNLFIGDGARDFDTCTSGFDVHGEGTSGFDSSDEGTSGFDRQGLDIALQSKRAQQFEITSNSSENHDDHEMHENLNIALLNLASYRSRPPLPHPPPSATNSTTNIDPTRFGHCTKHGKLRRLSKLIGSVCRPGEECAGRSCTQSLARSSRSAPIFLITLQATQTTFPSNSMQSPLIRILFLQLVIRSIFLHLPTNSKNPLHMHSCKYSSEFDSLINFAMHHQFCDFFLIEVHAMHHLLVEIHAMHHQHIVTNSQVHLNCLIQCVFTFDLAMHRQNSCKIATPDNSSGLHLVSPPAASLPAVAASASALPTAPSLNAGPRAFTQTALSVRGASRRNLTNPVAPLAQSAVAVASAVAALPACSAYAPAAFSSASPTWPCLYSESQYTQKVQT